MSDNDLIRREDVEKARDELVRVLNYINSSGTLDYADYCELFDTIERVFDALKVVPQEMSAREFAHERVRMCANHTPFCDACPVLPERMEDGKVMHDCPIWTMRDPDKAVAFVEKWTREHPEEGSDNNDSLYLRQMRQNHTRPVGQGVLADQERLRRDER